MSRRLGLERRHRDSDCDDSDASSGREEGKRHKAEERERVESEETLSLSLSLSLPPSLPPSLSLSLSLRTAHVPRTRLAICAGESRPGGDVAGTEELRMATLRVCCRQGRAARTGEESRAPEGSGRQASLRGAARKQRISRE